MGLKGNCGSLARYQLDSWRGHNPNSLAPLKPAKPKVKRKTQKKVKPAL